MYLTMYLNPWSPFGDVYGGCWTFSMFSIAEKVHNLAKILKVCSLVFSLCFLCTSAIILACFNAFCVAWILLWSLKKKKSIKLILVIIFYHSNKSIAKTVLFIFFKKILSYHLLTNHQYKCKYKKPHSQITFYYTY